MRAPNVPENPKFDPELPAADRLRVLLTTTPHEISRVVVPGMLHASLALKEGDTVVPAKARDLEGLSISRAQAFRDAGSRMRRTTSATDLLAIDTLPGLFVMITEDGLAASRMMLLPELLSPVPFGGILVAVPSVSQLFVAPLASPKDLGAMRGMVLALAQVVESVPERLSDQLFWYDGARWTHVGVKYDQEDVTVKPPPAFLRTLNHLAAIGLVRDPAEA